MNIKKLLSMLLAVVLLMSLVPTVGAVSFTDAKADDTEKRVEQLLDYSDRLHEMKQLYAPRVTKADAMENPYLNARIIVKSEHELDLSGSLAHVSGYNNWTVIQYATAQEAEKACQSFNKLSYVEYAAPDAVMSIAQQPHENSFLSWGYGPNHVGAFNYAEWLLEKTGDNVADLPEIIVGVVDTGIDQNHELFAGRLAPSGYDFVNNDSNPQDDHHHGTHVAGTVVDGTLPNVKVMGLKALDSGGYGDTSDIANAMEYGNLHGCQIVNLSLRGPYSASNYEVYSDVINTGTDNGTVYCVASGNDGGNAMNYLPGAVERAFTVAAHDQNRRMAYFSNTGACVDITAPGVGINSARPGGGYQTLNGTSMATPHVAAACALVLSYQPDTAPDTVISILKNAAVDEGLEGGGTGLLCVTDLLKYDETLNGEGGTLHFTSDGTYPWIVEADGVASGNAGVNSSVSTLTSKKTLGAFQRLRFEYRVSSEQNHDYLRFKVNGETVLETSGSNGWQVFDEVIESYGLTEFKWEFSKDAAGSGGSDKAWIRNVVLSETVSTVINGDGCQLRFDTVGDYPWTVDGDAAKSGNAGVNGSVSEIRSHSNVGEGLTIMFYYKTSCGSGDKFQFVVNDNVELEVTETTDWTAFEYTFPSEGSYVFSFRYVKDGSGAIGSDCAWVKGVSFIYSLSAALNAQGSRLVFVSTGSYPWVAEGDYAKSGNAGRSNSSSTVSTTISMQAGDTLRFRYRVSSEANYDKFFFYVNGASVFQRSGNVSWSEYTYTAPAADTYTFEWTYTKDSSVNNGDDAAYLDDVAFIRSTPGMLGDSDGSGTIEVADALLAMRYAMSLIDASALNIELADMNNNGSVTMDDALVILRIAMGLQAN